MSTQRFACFLALLLALGALEVHANPNHVMKTREQQEKFYEAFRPKPSGAGIPFPRRSTSGASTSASGLAKALTDTTVYPPAPVRPCDNSTNSKHPFCFAWLSYDERVKDLINRIEMNNTAQLLTSWSGNVSQQELWLPPYTWWNEGLHGVANSPGVTYDPSVGPVNATTSFPQVCVTAASFNKTLFAAIGNAIGQEGRAMHNVNQAGLTYWAPNINIYRDPRWGRGQETPGEDPYLTSVYAKNFVRNMQNNSMDPTRLRVSSCCKHYAAYDLENWGGQQRYWFDAKVSQYDLDHTYQVSFEACYHQDGGAASGMMCSYNAVNGVPSCANKKFITDIARGQWGFDGYVTSDCGATGDVQWNWAHNYTSNSSETVRVVFEAGEDTDCGWLLTNSVVQAVEEGVVTRGMVNTALGHTFKVQMRLGMFDPADEQPYSQLGPQDIDTPEHRQLALDAAREGITLLYNKNNALPLDPTYFMRPDAKIAVLGSLANNSAMLLGNYYGNPPYIINPLDALTARFGSRVSYNIGLNHVEGGNTEWFETACKMASESDVTLLFLGNDQNVESEGNDRWDIGMPGIQNLFAYHTGACARRNGKKIIVVAFSGGSLDYRQILQVDSVHGLIWAGYPGQSGGQAIVEILFGDISPSGRLVQTAYPREYQSMVEMTDMQMEANETTGNPGRTYKYYTGTPVFPFAWGLSYSNWSFVIDNGDGARSEEQQDALPTIRVNAREVQALVQRSSPLFTLTTQPLPFTLTNLGPMAAAASVLLKVTKDPPSVEIGGELVDFEKYFLEVGQSVNGTLGLNAHAFVRIHEGQRVVQTGRYKYEIDVMGIKRHGILLLQ